jgi:hypothetical protein
MLVVRWRAASTTPWGGCRETWQRYDSRRPSAVYRDGGSDVVQVIRHKLTAGPIPVTQVQPSAPEAGYTQNVIARFLRERTFYQLTRHQIFNLTRHQQQSITAPCT